MYCLKTQKRAWRRALQEMRETGIAKLEITGENAGTCDAYNVAMKIVLAHGILGFGGGLLPFGINYFNVLKGVFEQQGFEVFAPTVAPLGSLEVRSEQLARQIESHWP